MTMDRSKKVGSQPRHRADGASGKTGNALGPKHMVSVPAGRAQLRDQETSASGKYRASGKRGNPRNVGATSAIPAKQLSVAAGVITPIDMKPYFENYDTIAGTWSMTGGPAGLTINTTTGVISGTPTTVSTGTATITAKGLPTTVPAQVSTPWSWVIVA